MFPVAVGAFNLEVINLFDRFGVAENVVGAAPDVAAEQKAVQATGVANVEDNLRGAKDVPGITKSNGDTVDDRKGTVVVDGHKLANRPFSIRGGIKGLDRRLAFLRPFFGDKLGVGALNFGGIFEHDRGEVARGERAVNVSGVALATEVWQITAVVDVRVAEDNGIELLRIEREIAITLDGFVTFALEQPAFEEEALLIDFEQKEGAGCGAGGAEEVDLHGVRMMRRI